MFSPASLKNQSPAPIDEKVRKRFLILYLMIIILSFVPCSLFEYYYIVFFWRDGYYWLFFLLLPFNVLILIYILQFSAAFFSFLFLTILKLLYKPKEGVFQRDTKDRDYFFWNLRNLVKNWPLFVLASNPFPWFKNRFTLRIFGVKIGRHCICDNGWLSSEFVSIGKNVIIGMGSTILSFGIVQDNLIIKKIIVEEGVEIGAKCVLLPGTIIKKNAKLSAHSYTNYDDILNEDSIYIGHPALLKKKNQ